MTKRNTAGLLLATFVVFTASVALAQADKRSVSQVLDKQLSSVEAEFVPAAEAMPDDKYSFAPTSGEFKGVRTFAQQVKHVAAVNYEVGAALLGTKPPVDIGKESGPDSLTTKTQIVQFLKDSFVYLHKAIITVSESNLVEPLKSPWGSGSTNRLELALEATGHPYDHYGQMVEYLRMNGVVPPASR